MIELLWIPFGLLYSNAAEWWIHKRLLHDMGKDKSSVWHVHWGEHHKNVRSNGYHDAQYDKAFWDRNGPKMETLGVIGLMIAHLPLAPVAPLLTATVIYCGCNFIHKHQKAHRKPEWARKNLRWHYDHHMGKNQDSNFCITKPWFDHMMGTREYCEYEKKASDD